MEIFSIDREKCQIRQSVVHEGVIDKVGELVALFARGYGCANPRRQHADRECTQDYPAEESLQDLPHELLVARALVLGHEMAHPQQLAVAVFLSNSLAKTLVHARHDFLDDVPLVLVGAPIVLRHSQPTLVALVGLHHLCAVGAVFFHDVNLLLRFFNDINDITVTTTDLTLYVARNSQRYAESIN